MGAASQTVAVLGDGTEDAETDAADEARRDDVAVAEAGGAEVDIDAGREDQMSGSRRRGGEERGQKIGE